MAISLGMAESFFCRFVLQLVNTQFLLSVCSAVVNTQFLLSICAAVVNTLFLLSVCAAVG